MARGGHAAAWPMSRAQLAEGRAMWLLEIESCVQTSFCSCVERIVVNVVAVVRSEVEKMQRSTLHLPCTCFAIQRVCCRQRQKLAWPQLLGGGHVWGAVAGGFGSSLLASAWHQYYSASTQWFRGTSTTSTLVQHNIHQYLSTLSSHDFILNDVSKYYLNIILWRPLVSTTTPRLNTDRYRRRNSRQTKQTEEHRHHRHHDIHDPSSLLGIISHLSNLSHSIDRTPDDHLPLFYVYPSFSASGSARVAWCGAPSGAPDRFCSNK